MLSKDPQFRKLKIRCGGVVGTASYWLGPDHLLIVTVEGYNERYRRIYFRDVQAIIIRRTSVWIWLTVVLSALTVVAGILPMTTGDTEGMIVGSIMLVPLGLALIGNLIAGPTGSCRVITAVQNRDLPHLNRLKTANRLLETLQVEVNRVQRPTEQPVVETPIPAPAEPDARATDQPTK